MITYSYPINFSGISSNIWNNCRWSLGILPVSTSLAQEDNLTKLYISFDNELSAQNKSILDNLITGSGPGCGYAPLGSPKFIITDIWEKYAQFTGNCGIGFKLYYGQSVPSQTGIFDQLLLYADNNLTTNQKNKTSTEYGKLITTL